MLIHRRQYFQITAGLAAWALAPGICRASPANRIISTPKLNQLGFLPASPKRFCVADDTTIPSNATFAVEDEAGRPIHRGLLGPAIDIALSAGERVRAGDFSLVTARGRYRIRVGERLSPTFAIDDAVYLPLVRDAARAFFIIRANEELNDPVTGLNHAAAHQVERALRVDGVARDLRGGWYNAGDYGKWTHMAAISASQMMWLDELRRDGARRLSLNTPPSWPSLPDLLQQARWGLEWLLRMQNLDGGVLHKVDSEPLFAWGLAPEADDRPRRARGPGSVDTGDFVGVMLQAERVFAPLDAPFAARCRAAAEASWAWLERNPRVLTEDPYYLDHDPTQERLWATAAMAAATCDDTLAVRAITELKACGAAPYAWPSPQLLGLMSLARSKSPAAPHAQAAIIRASEASAAQAAKDPYGYATDTASYSWGSNELMLDRAVLCLFAAEFDPRGAHRATAQRFLDHVLGCNALDQCFVTAHGQRPVRHPYHWTMRVYGNALPGWASGGANGFSAGADPLLAEVIERGTPPAKCYVDACTGDGSWASNEGQTSQNAALLLVAGMLAW